MRSWSPWFARRVLKKRFPFLRLFEDVELGASFHKQIWPGEIGDDVAAAMSVPIVWGAESRH